MLTATDFVEKSLKERFTKEDALEVLNWPDENLEELIKAAYKIRQKFFGNEVMIHVLLNAKSGLCPEDCGFCTQSSSSNADISRYPVMDSEEIFRRAEKAKKSGAYRFCIVISSKGPSEKEFTEVSNAVRKIKEELGMRICASLGELTFDQAVALKNAGLDRYNHNLETSEMNFPNICSTHTYRERVQTVKNAQRAGISPCCGMIAGMGETKEDLVDLAFTFKGMNVESIPINLLNPVKGTLLQDQQKLLPEFAIKILAMMRFVNPDREIRIAGGRERVLKHLQYTSLKIANSMFTNGYLTTPGMSDSEDIAELKKMGFTIVT